MNAMFTATAGLIFSPSGATGHGAGGRDRRHEAPQPPLRLSRIVKLDEEVRGVGQVPVAAGDEALDVGQDVVGEACAIAASRGSQLLQQAAHAIGRHRPNRRARARDR